ncbi:hypothetical protein ES288_A04G134900v1 [Gossypium darwinii]|uniref:Uncharacterized protein n=1 Tax=Gossypium darwinii TaxID=34276 RepID=A0A5D2GYY7_GOSDA|nr:hypothetical protein ES288_A04G134900v1 [Gossypium darwinii]
MTSHSTILKFNPGALTIFLLDRLRCGSSLPLPAATSPLWSQTIKPEADLKFRLSRLYQTGPLHLLSPLLGYGYFR